MQSTNTLPVPRRAWWKIYFINMEKLIENFRNNETEISKITGGAGVEPRPELLYTEEWTDGVNTYEDQYWTDGPSCSHFIGCDC